MYQKHLIFGQDDYLELASRLTSEGEHLLFSLRGKKSNEEFTISSAVLSKQEVENLIQYLNDWVETQE